jgi:serine acetyltransferase
MKSSFARRGFNRILHLMARFLPGATTLRPALHRWRGVKISGTVFIGDDVYLENEFPECVEINDGAVIGLRTAIIAHTGGRGGQGKIIIGKKAVIMSCCTIVCSAGRTLTIGESSVLSAGSIVSSDIPPNTFCAGPRVRAIARVTVPFTLDTTYEDFRRGLQTLRGGPPEDREDQVG